jgi:signal transduction histidine kinase
MDNQFYKDVVNALPFAFLVLDKELIVVECNKSCESLFLKLKSDILDRRITETIPHKDLQNQAKAVLQNGGSKLLEINVEGDSPKILRAIITAINIPTRSEEKLCLISLEDITQRSELEAQLVQYEKLMAMGLLASTITHELGNPLSIMSTTLEYVKNTLLDATDQELKNRIQKSDIVKPIEIVMDSIEQMHELLRTLSGFTGFQRPRLKFSDFRQILLNMLTFIHKEAEARNIKVSHHINNLPELEIDQREIKQLLLNLLKNAIEAMPEGGELNVHAHISEDKDKVCVHISDTGHGLSEAEQRLIFKPFYSTKSGGTGLGLPFCRRVVEEHGGEISVNSKKGKGTVFTIILPIKQEEL